MSKTTTQAAATSKASLEDGPWARKLAKSGEKLVKPSPMNFGGMRRGQIMLIPTPKLIEDYVRNLERGESRSVQEMRSEIAALHEAEVSCPVTTGIHLRTVVEAAHEAFERGQPIDSVTPVWRVLEPEAPTLKKVSFDAEWVTNLRQAEGLRT